MNQINDNYYEEAGSWAKLPCFKTVNYSPSMFVHHFLKHGLSVHPFRTSVACPVVIELQISCATIYYTLYTTQF